jgi:uncharacterized protein
VTPPKAVFDAMCYLQAVTNPDGPAWAAMALSDSGRLKIVASEETLSEVSDILSRPNLVRKFPPLTGRRAPFFEVIRAVAEVWPDVPKAVSHPRDPKDEPYLDLAVASGAAYLVTRDKDMLDLMADADFTSKYPNLKILGPVELLRELTPPLKVEDEKARDVGREP